MRKAPRSSPAQGNHGQGAPTTPHGAGASDPIDDIIHSLDVEWKLGLQVRGLQSPSSLPDTTATRITGHIKRLWWRDRPKLVQGIEDFALLAPAKSHDERIDTICRLLSVPTGTPKSLIREGPWQTSSSFTPRSFASKLSGQLPPSPAYRDARSNGRGSSSYASAQEGGSTTDDDEDDDQMPPSPTTSSKAAQRRVKASPRTSDRSAGKKRLPESPENDHISPKMCKTSNGRQSSEYRSAESMTEDVQSKSPFKKPSVALFRSFQSTSLQTSFTKSMNTSFNTDSTPMSSQQSATQPFTANTSFTSDIGDKDDQDALRPRMTRSSSTTIGSGLDDEDFVEVSHQLERETSDQIHRERLQASGNVATYFFHSSGNETRESTSTFGSIDEDALVETSFRIESDMDGFGPGSSPTRPFLRSDSARLGSSPSSQSRNSRTSDSAKRSRSKHHVSSTEISPTRRIIQPRRNPKEGHFPTEPTVFQSSTSSIMQQHSLHESSLFNPVSPHPVGVTTNVPMVAQPDLATEPSPPKLTSKLPPSETQAQSPSKMSHHIYRIPEQNLFVEDIADQLKGLPYFVLFICCRIAMERKISILDLTKDLSQGWSDPTTFWRTITERCPQVGTQESKGLWVAQKRAFDGYTFKGQVVINKMIKGPVFLLKLLPVAKDLSCRFQRHFDADRFLFLNFPSFDHKKQPQPPRFPENELKQIEKRWVEWYSREHSFLGRTWRAFHIEPLEKKNKLSKGDIFDKRVILFATEGCGIEKPVSIGELINWFVPLALNKEQNFCKAYARLNLGLSRTTPTLAFKPSQVLYVPDIKADGYPEDIRYNDDSLPWDEHYEEEEVMNDGCSLMSVGAAHEIWKRYKKAVDTSDPMPSVFQGRIGCAKGMWMVSAESYSRDRDHRSVWIEINESQKKFEPHPEDRSDDLLYDADRLTFELCAYSSQPNTSDLHISFIPILTDRGVPKETIETLVAERLDQERSQLLEILPNPLRMYDWIFKQSAIAQKHEEIRWQAAMPHALPDKIKLMLESGFDPTKAPYLAKCLHRFIKQDQLWMEQKLRIPLGKAAFLYGVADPLGVLAPGEVHIQFSRPFVDTMTDEHFRYLNDMDLLVSRQPACRRSDIQRVRATTRFELAHFVDTVVFSSRGQYPLAGKLQGGDYDGDIFWICWEQALVQPFKNAPPPIQALNPLRYAIKKDNRRLREVMNPDDLSTVDSLLKEVLTFRTNPSLLGIVTSFLEKQAYKENRIHSTKLNSLYDIHDLLVDAPKQAYTFTEQDWRNFIKFDLRCGNPRNPAYKMAMEACEKVKEMGEVDNERAKKYKIKEDNIIDHLYFNVVRKHDVETLKMVKESLSKVIDDDEALRYPYLAVQKRDNPAMELELEDLRLQLTKVNREWNKGMMSNPNGGTSDNYNRTVEEVYKKFRSLMPTQPANLEISIYLHPVFPQRFSMWETLRASVLYTAHPDKVAFVWHMAGRELAELKVRSLPGSRSVCWPIHRVLRPKLLKVPRHFEGDASDDEDQASADEGQVADP